MIFVYNFSCFISDSSATALDFHLYSVLLYLLIFRFDEIKLSFFKKLIKNQNLLKILRYFNSVYAT